MILCAAEGMPNDQIAACLDTRREVVSMWRKLLAHETERLHRMVESLLSFGPD